MAVADVAMGRFDIGRVFTRTFEVIRANFVPFFLLGIIATIPTSVYAVLTAARVLPDATAALQGGAAALYFTAAAIATVIGAFGGLILQAAVTYAAISYLSDQRVSLGRAVGVGLRQFFPLIAIGILQAFGLMGGFLLLIFPAIMLLVMWSMVVPARVAEHTGILHSFGRSRELTYGYRWPIFGTLVVLWIGSAIAQAAIRPMVAAGQVSATIYVGAVLTALVTAIVAVASATLHASIYYELRVIKEGAGPAQIAAIFD